MERRGFLSSLESAALGGALVLVGGGLGAALYPRLAGKPRAPASRTAETFAPRPANAPPVAAPAVPALTSQELAELLNRRRGDPVAERFAAEFLAAPLPRAAWDQYQKDGDLVAGLRKLLKMPEFMDLWARFSEDPGFKPNVDVLLVDARFSQAMFAAEKPEPAPAAPVQIAKRIQDPEAMTADENLAVGELVGQLPVKRSTGWLMVVAGIVVAAATLKLSRRRRESADPEATAGPATSSLGERYQIVRTVSRTETEELQEARDVRLDRVVAIRRLTGGDPERHKRLAQAASIVHPALLSVYEVVEEGGSLCVVSELCQGKTVAQIVAERGRVSGSQAAQVFEPACRALEIAHARGIFHGRLTPEMLFLTEHGVVKVLELGMFALPAGADGRRADVEALAACWRDITGSDDLIRETAGAQPRLRTAAELATRLKGAISLEKTGVL